jgi:hypothetical protein
MKLLASKSEKKAAGMVTAQQDASGVSSTIELLEKLKADVVKDLADDLKFWTDMDEWCTTTKTQKEQDIQNNETQLATLKGLIEGNGAGKAVLEVEIEGLQKSIAKNQAALAKAEELHAEVGENVAL